MAMLPHDPFDTINVVRRELNRLLNTGLGRGGEEETVHASDWIPALDIKEDENRFVVYADIPGVRAQDIEITMESGVLIIKGQRTLGVDEAEREPGYTHRERSQGTFLRRLTFPDSVDPEQVQANIDAGVLEIVIPKGAKVQPRRIEIQG